MNREAISTALFALLSAATISSQPAFKTTYRRVDLWAKTSPKQKPALYLGEPRETYIRDSRAIPQKVVLEYQVFIYTDAQDPNIIPMTQLNNILDAIDTALQPKPLPGQETYLTLGNLVAACWIEGEILKAQGYQEGTVLALVPIKVVVPA